MSMLGIGFIGVGGMGRYQARAFAQLDGRCRIVAGSDLADGARAEFAKQCPQASVYTTPDELLADRRVDAVVVAVPTGFHREVAEKTLRARRHLLVEKPMCRTVAECRQLLDVAQKHDKQVLMVAHCRRFDTDWGTFAQVYRSGELGEPLLWRHVVAVVPAFAPWFLDDRLGGGPLIDGAIHDEDFTNYLWGDADYAVGSSIKLKSDCTAIDTGTAIVRYRNGNQLSLSWSWASNGQHMHDVLGPKASFVFGAHGLEVPPGARGHCLLDKQANKRLVTFEPRDMYVTQAGHFLDCIEGRAKCVSPGTEAIKAVAVAEAILIACREGGACPVEHL